MTVFRCAGAPAPEGADRWVRLAALWPPGRDVAYAWTDAAPGADCVAFEAIVETRGPLPVRPAFGITADWLVAPGGDVAGFIASREALFALRTEHIPVFHTDWLLRRVGEPNRFTVLGLYGDRFGLDQARGHPAIAAWNAANPAAAFGARDEHGVSLFEISGLLGL